MNKFAIAVHGGASSDSAFIREHKLEYEQGLKKAALSGHTVLKDGGTAIEAVTAAVKVLEDNELFNAGRGAALTIKGDVEMDASIMDGSNLKAGAIAMVTGVKNPIELARAVMEKTSHVLLSGHGALEFAKDQGIQFEDESYFITAHQQEELLNTKNELMQELLQKPVKGTVGAVALDSNGNLAAATSTGGTTGSLAGRIGDSCIIGAGCYANNKTCAISGTGDGEFLITGVIAHAIAMAMQYKQLSIQEACDYVIFQESKNLPADMGVIGVSTNGEIGIAFNCERMHRAWIDTTGALNAKIYL